MNEKLTEQEKKKYVDHMGVVCPVEECSSTDFESMDSFQSDAGCVWREYKCMKCGKEFCDVYKLVAVEDV